MRGRRHRVLIDGVERTRLSSGANVGEFALPHDVARTATMRAMTPTRLVALSGLGFLAAVMVR